MYKIIVCDDNKEFMEVLVLLLKRYASLYHAEVIGYNKGNDVLEYCRNNRCDIIYMDIEVGNENGMSIAKVLKRMHPQLLIIYISAYNSYYTDMVQAEPFRFIFKDMTDAKKFEKEVADTLDTAMNRINSNELWVYEFQRRQYVVELGKVQYFRSFARSIYIIGDIGETPGRYYGKMDDLQREIEKINSNFVRVSKSYMVNMRYVRYAGADKIKLEDIELTISGKYKEDFKKMYIQYWKTKF